MIAALVHSGKADGTLDDQDTLVQLREISDLLNTLDIQVKSTPFGPSLGDLERYLQDLKPHFIFNLVETVRGSDSLLYTAASFFEYLNIPYTGCSAISLATLTSKLQQKKIMHLAGLPVPSQKTSASEKWIVKSDTEHASKGIDSDSLVGSLIEAESKIVEKEAFYGGHWFTESFIDGREFNISILETLDGHPQILNPAEILFLNSSTTQPKIVDYSAKWETSSQPYLKTPRCFDFKEKDNSLLEQLRSLSLECWDLFQLKGAARIDFRVDILGSPWILEVNANPCLSSDAGFMAAAEQTGLSPQEVVRRLIPRIMQKEL